MKTYWALVAFNVAPGEERQSHIHFQAEGPRDAVRSAERFAHGRERAFPGWKLTCIKAGVFDAAPIMADGSLLQSNLPNFFEWKYDWPGTLEDRIELIRE